MNWTHFNPVQILSGVGIRHQLAGFLPVGKVLLVTSSGMVKRGVAVELTKTCPQTSWEICTVSPNPDLDDLDALADGLKDQGITAVVALGGGSAMDSAKALATILSIQGKGILSQFLREAMPDPPPPMLPLICLPTTSGTGSEVTPFATIWDTKKQVKRSLAGGFVYPNLALLDPELTISLPWDTTLYGGLDAISHALESLWNRKVTPLSSLFAIKSLELAHAHLPILEHDPKNIRARKAMQEASTLAGLAISQNRTTIAHSISYPLTLAFDLPHGLACGFSLPALMTLVSEKKAWQTEIDSQLLGKIQDMLRGFQLPQYVEQYCCLEQAIEHVDAMFVPGQTGNFAVGMDKASIETILLKSF